MKSEEYLADDIQSNGNLNFSLTLNNSSSLSTLHSSLKGGGMRDEIRRKKEKDKKI